MKKAFLYIGIALAAIGCTKDADITAPSGDNTLTFTSNIATRADKSAWVNTDAIGVYMTSTSADATFGDGGANKEYTTSGDGNFSSTDPLYLPSSGSVEIFAYYPYKDFDNESDFNLTAYSITSSEQVDLLRATDDNVSSSDVKLQFNHVLSKISLTIENGAGVELNDLDDLEVTISGIYTEATFDLEKGEVNEADLSENSTPLKFDTSITKESEEVKTISSSAIVIPQTLSGATPTLYFTTSGDNSKKYSATIPAEAFVTGLEYSYTITIKKSEVTISSATINNWNDGKPTSGTADIVDIEGKSDGVLYINSAAGLKAFADLVNGVDNDTAIYAGFDNVDYGSDLESGVKFGTSYTNIKGVLTRDIDLSTIDDESWTPIGKTSDTAFAGTFNGGGYCVSELNINTGSKLGLFGYLDTDGLVNNIGVEGSITTTSEESAGIVAYNYGWIMNSYSEVTLSGGINTGGIAGYNIGNVVNCYNRGNVEGTNNVGGIVGQNAAGGYVGYSFSVGDVSGSERVGGVVGWNHTTTATAPTIKGCFCLDLDDGGYSIGQLEYVSSSGSYDGNMYDKDYLTSEVFAILMNNGAYTYNENDGGVHTAPPNSTMVCAWVYNSEPSDYPTLDVSTKPEYSNKVYDIIYNSGTYEIYTAAGLKVFANLVNNGGISKDDDFVTSGNFDSYFAVTTSSTDRSSINGSLMKDIDLKDICGATIGDEGTSVSWTPIGTNDSDLYSGTFNGNGKLVSNLYVSGVTYAGLFGCTNSSATISNLGVSGLLSGDDSSNSYNGAVVGRNNGGVITNCYAIRNSSSSTTESNSEYTAGVVGYNTGTIANCYSSGMVVGKSAYVTGGVVGNNTNGTIINCYSSAEVYIGNASWLGGVVGYNAGTSTITSCYWDSSVTGATAGVGNETTSNGVSSSEDMKAASFVTLLNSNAYSYNSNLSASATEACAWLYNDSGYPTLDFGEDPGTTYSTLSEFTADSYPVGNVWYITDYDATADEASDFSGLRSALGKVSGVTVVFSNLETLPETAFQGCTDLTSISLPSATTIGWQAFNGCYNLTSISLPSATKIEWSAFGGCTSLTSISLPSATEIGIIAFTNCTSLTELDLGSSGSGISSIGSDAFYNVSTETKVDLTIKVATGDDVSVSVSGTTLTYNTSDETIFKSITVITTWSLE